MPSASCSPSGGHKGYRGSAAAQTLTITRNADVVVSEGYPDRFGKDAVSEQVTAWCCRLVVGLEII